MLKSIIRPTHYLILLGIVGLSLWTLPAAASPNRPPTIAIYNLVSAPILDQSIMGIKQGLMQRGFGGDKIHIVEINANNQTTSLDAFSREILSSHPDVAVPVSTPVTQSLIKLAPPNQAVVFSTVTNPNDVGMDHKPGNLTGVSDAVDYAANVKLIRSLLPRAKIIGIIYNPSEKNSQFGMDKIRPLMKRYGFQLKIVAISNSGEIVDAARSLSGVVDAFYVGSDNTMISGIDGLLAIAAQHHLAVIASDGGSVEKGALAAVSVDYVKLGITVGHIVGDILRTGRQPGTVKNIIFVGKTLVINRPVAKRLGISISKVEHRAGAKFIDQ